MKSQTTLYIAGEQVTTLYFVEKESDTTPLLWMDVRADLTFHERAGISDAVAHAIKAAEEDAREKHPNASETLISRLAIVNILAPEVLEAVAPYVLDWSVGEMKRGKPVKITPPAIGGADQLRYLPEACVSRLVTHLLGGSTREYDLKTSLVVTDPVPKVDAEAVD